MLLLRRGVEDFPQRIGILPCHGCGEAITIHTALSLWRQLPDGEWTHFFGCEHCITKNFVWGIV